MPIQKVHGGYKFGKVGKVYRTKKKAEKQMRAMYAHGLAEETKDLPTFTNFINESEAVSNISKSFEELKSGDKLYRCKLFFASTRNKDFGIPDSIKVWSLTVSMAGYINNEFEISYAYDTGNFKEGIKVQDAYESCDMEDDSSFIATSIDALVKGVSRVFGNKVGSKVLVSAKDSGIGNSNTFASLSTGDKFYVWKANDREYIYEYTFQDLEKDRYSEVSIVGTNSFTGNETFPLSQDEFHKSIVKIDANGKDVDLDNYKISDLKTLICVDKNEILDILRTSESDIVK